MRTLTRCTPSQYVSRFDLACIVHLTHLIQRTALPDVTGSVCSPLTSTVDMHLPCLLSFRHCPAVAVSRPSFNVSTRTASMPYYDARTVTGTITVCDTHHGAARPG